MKKIVLALMFTGSLILPNAAFGASSDKEFCDAYAVSAMEQNLENLEYKCGFGPPVWSPNYEHHFNWCMQGNRGPAKIGEIGRSKSLASCRGKTSGTGDGESSGSKRAFCNQYANDARYSQKLNVKQGCGFGGPKWSSNYKHHYSWCLQSRVKRSFATSEQDARQARLNGC